MSRLKKGLAGAVTGAGLLAVAFVGGWEGKELKSYRDIVDVWTVCAGITRNIGPNMTFTDAQCDEMLMTELITHETGMRACLKRPDALPTKTYVSFLSLTYNIGVRGFCRSTAARRINAGNLPGACQAATWFNKAGGRVVKGLKNRRAAEYKLCMEGLAE